MATSDQRIPADGMDPATALALIEKVAAGISVAHRLGVVHGRVRPENILFDDDDNPYVADLGIDEICTGIVSFATHAYDAPERLGGALATPACGHLLPRPVGLRGARRLAATRRMARCRSEAMPSTPSSPGRPIPTRTAAMVRSTSSSTSCATALAVPLPPSALFVPTRNPYRGLAPFEEADARDFHGRERVVAEMVDVLRRERLMVVFGPSGIGKSSVVKAGLVPALRRGAVDGSESWLVTEMTPGNDPFEQLRQALGRVATTALPDVVDALSRSAHTLDEIVRRVVPPGTNVVIVVDQFEELFTQTIDEGARRAFVQMLVDTAAEPDAVVRIVVTLRADFLDRPLGYAGFADAIKGRTIALGAMSAAELAEAVRRPAAGVGVDVEPALVDRITAEAADAPGALPLVQHQMAELFAQRTANVLTLAAYEESGGLAGAIGRRAEAIYARARRPLPIGGPGGVPPPRQRGRGARGHPPPRPPHRTGALRGSAPTSWTWCCASTAATGCSRSIAMRPPGHRRSKSPTRRCSREWPRLKDWIDDARDDLLTRRRIESAAHDWLAAGSDASFLFTGGRLELAESWAAESDFELTEDEQRFLTASRTRVDRDAAARATAPAADHPGPRRCRGGDGGGGRLRARPAFGRRPGGPRDTRPRARRPGPAGHRGGPGAGDHARPRRQ